MEHMISARFHLYLKGQNLLTPEQAGFGENHSIDEQVLYISQIKEAFNREENTVSIFFDFQNAYDSLWRYKLSVGPFNKCSGAPNQTMI